jgi:alpha-glucosidase (family GH31 glycosyl hydrolase)
MESYHYSTDEYGKEHYKQYNLHNIYNYYENKMTHDFIEQKLNRRPYVVSRSTSPGCGRHVSKWLGDNFASWTHMRMSIVGMLNFQIFGVPHVGADICGFVGNPDAELCARWYQLGAFSPFTRNQNFVTMIPQEPYEFGGIVVEAARNSILQKYSIARYYYNNMFDIAINGGMLVRALFYDYPSDAEAYATKELTFLIGKGILVVPILFPGAKNVSVYLPPSIWYDLRNYSQVSDITKSHNISFEASYLSTIVLIKGGEIIPFQDALRYNTKRIRDLDSLPTVLLVALDENETARGKLIVDNTDEPYTIRELAYRQYSFSFDNRALKFSKIADNIEQRYGYEILEAIVIMGAIQFNQSTEAFVEYNNGDSATCQCKFFTGNNTLQIQLKADIRTIKEISIR